jgi:hypothetical protein
LDDAEASGIRDTIALTGRPLYRELFVGKADPNLAEAIEILEAYEENHPGSAPLRLQIQTDLDLALTPLQLQLTDAIQPSCPKHRLGAGFQFEVRDAI